MAILFKYGKRCYVAGEMKGVVEIDTSSFHGVITANNLTPRSGEQVTLKATMDEGYTLKCFVVDNQNITGNSFTAHLGINSVTALEAITPTQEILQKPILSLYGVLSMSSDNTKLYKPSLYIDSIISNHYDKAPNVILKPPGLILQDVTTTHVDELKQLEITSIDAKWITSGSSTLYQMTIWADSNSMDSDLYVNGAQSSLYMGSWTKVGNSCFYLGYFGQAEEGKTYTFNLKKKGYKDSASKTHTVANKGTVGEKDIKISTWVKEYETDTYPSIVTNGATVKGTEDDTYKSIFAKSSLTEPEYLDSSKCSYSYTNGVCYIYGWNMYSLKSLSTPSVTNYSAEYWLNSGNDGSVLVSAKIANPNAVTVTAHITLTYTGSGIMSDYTVSKAISKNSYIYINPTIDINQPSQGEIIKMSVYFTALNYSDSATSTTNISMSPREEEVVTPTLSAPVISSTTNNCATITVRYANPSSNPGAKMSIDGNISYVGSGSYKDVTYDWSSGVSSMTKTAYISTDGYTGNQASKTFTKGTSLVGASITNLEAEYWMTDSTDGSVMISGKINNPNSESVTATVTFTYLGSGQMSTQSKTYSVSANGSTLFNPTFSINQPSAGESFRISVSLSKSGYSSATSSTSVSMTLRE